MPWYDQWGWASITEITDRYTDLPIPDNIPDGHAANWTGHAWIIIPYSAPPGPPAEPVYTKMTKLAFRNRFTQAEKVAIEIAGLDNPAATMPERALAAGLRASQQDLAVAQYIDTSRPETRAGVQQLEAFGLLGVGRALVILDTPIAEIEKFVS